jgi:hypothetical protein
VVVDEATARLADRLEYALHPAVVWRIELTDVEDADQARCSSGAASAIAR